MKAIILAGGFGTRLKSKVPDLPKPMAPVAGRPFLEYILDLLVNCQLDQVILSVGYRYESIQSHFGSSYKGLSLSYAIEDSPLGTGGAIKTAIHQYWPDDYLIVNGDTYLDLNFVALTEWYRRNTTRLAMVLKQVEDVSRYGAITVDNNNHILGFNEKNLSGKGLINAGVYLLHSSVMDDCPTTKTFSFETDFLQARIDTLKPMAYVTDCYFIDIGIPEDYERAQLALGADA